MFRVKGKEDEPSEEKQQKLPKFGTRQFLVDQNVNLFPFISVAIILSVWEIFAHVLKLFTPYANIILPSWEYIIGNSLPGLAVFYGFGMPGTYGTTSSYPVAFLVLFYHSFVTFMRIVSGTFVGAFLGVGLGLIMGWNKTGRSLIYPPLLFIRTVPLLALIPLFLIWFGGRETGAVLYVAFGVFVALVINTVEAIRNVSPVYQKFAYTLGATRGRVFRTVIFPAIMPELRGGIRVVIGISWALTLAVEYLGSQSGLGRLMILSKQYLYTGRMIVIVFLYMGYSILLNQLFLRLSRSTTRWMPEY